MRAVPYRSAWQQIFDTQCMFAMTKDGKSDAHCVQQWTVHKLHLTQVKHVQQNLVQDTFATTVGTVLQSRVCIKCIQTVVDTRWIHKCRQVVGYTWGVSLSMTQFCWLLHKSVMHLNTHDLSSGLFKWQCHIHINCYFQTNCNAGGEVGAYVRSGSCNQWASWTTQSNQGHHCTLLTHDMMMMMTRVSYSSWTQLGQTSLHSLAGTTADDGDDDVSSAKTSFSLASYTRTINTSVYTSVCRNMQLFSESFALPSGDVRFQSSSFLPFHSSPNWSVHRSNLHSGVWGRELHGDRYLYPPPTVPTNIIPILTPIPGTSFSTVPFPTPCSHPRPHPSPQTTVLIPIPMVVNDRKLKIQFAAKYLNNDLTGLLRNFTHTFTKRYAE